MFRPTLITSLCYKLVTALPDINGLGWNFPWLFSALGWMFWQQRFNHFIGQKNRGSSTTVESNTLVPLVFGGRPSKLTGYTPDAFCNSHGNSFSFSLQRSLSGSKAAELVERFAENFFLLLQQSSYSGSAELPHASTPLNASALRLNAEDDALPHCPGGRSGLKYRAVRTATAPLCWVVWKEISLWNSEIGNSIQIELLWLTD